jgi:hypothetical protein
MIQLKHDVGLAAFSSSKNHCTTWWIALLYKTVMGLFEIGEFEIYVGKLSDTIQSDQVASVICCRPFCTNLHPISFSSARKRTYNDNNIYDETSST